MTFDRAVKFVIAEEGGFVDSPKDPGGATKYGISQKSYPFLNIRYITVEEAIEIYRTDYWEKLPTLSDRLGFLVFDAAVNVGVTTAIKMLQQAVGVKPDGYFGPQSKMALERVERVEVLIRFQAERARHYALLDDLDDTYARGWMRRTMRAFYRATTGEI
jgi:lysozyme family protein